jgi:hypothetical protein
MLYWSNQLTSRQSSIIQTIYHLVTSQHCGHGQPRLAHGHNTERCNYCRSTLQSPFYTRTVRTCRGTFTQPRKSSWLPHRALWAICLKKRPSPLTPRTSFSLLTASNTEDSSSWSLHQNNHHCATYINLWQWKNIRLPIWSALSTVSLCKAEVLPVCT